jgi:outer membrane protein insertion porin family
MMPEPVPDRRRSVQQEVPRLATGGAAADQRIVPRQATGGAAAVQQEVPRLATGGAASIHHRVISLAMLPWVIASGLPLLVVPASPAAAQAQASQAEQAPQGSSTQETHQPQQSPPAAQEPAAPPVVPLVTPTGPPAGGQPAGPAGAGATGAAAPGAPAAGAPGHAVVAPALAGKKIAALEFKGLKTLSEETLLYYLGLEIGQPLDEERLNKAIKSLWDRGLVDDLKIDSTLVAAGVKLTITVQERPILKSIEYEGLKRLSKTDIQDKIATQRIKVREAEPMSLGELQRVKTLIEDLYREKGYRFAQARYTVQDLAGNDKKVVFKVDEGDRVRIAKIIFTGNHVIGGLRLRWAMKDTKESNLVTRIMKKDVYDPAKLQEDLDKVREVYHGEGYKNVAIGDPQIEVKAKHPNAAAIKDQQRRMFITIPVEENDRWRLGQVSLEGNKIYPDAALMRAFSLRPGAWLRSKALDDSVKKIRDTYANTGYVYSRVEPELVERAGHVADLVVHINEGDQFKVGRIEFSGNDRTRDKVLRREVRLYEGGLVNIAAVKNSILKINQLGYFKLEEEGPVDIEANSEKKEVNLVFKGREANRTELNFGGGWSEIDGFFIQFSVSTKNFLGRGEQAGVSVQTGRYRKLYDFNYNVPWWLDRPQSIGFRAFDSDLNYQALVNTQYIQKSKGVVLTYGRNYGLFNQASLSYTYSRNTESESLLTPIGTTTTSLVPPTYLINTSSIKPAWVRDSRDNPFEPVRGMRMAASLEYGGGPLGGNDNFLRPDVSFSLFAPVTSRGLKTVFAVNGEVGLLHSTTNRQLSPLEFFFIGGENSIRGMRFRSVTVRDSRGFAVLDTFGAGVGGDKFMQYNVEYHFLTGGPFRVLLFADAGNVYGEVPRTVGALVSCAPSPTGAAPPKGLCVDQSFDFGHLRYTAGVEMRVLIPLFGAPLRFIYSKNLRPQPLDEFETFQFSIGTSF